MSKRFLTTIAVLGLCGAGLTLVGCEEKKAEPAKPAAGAMKDATKDAAGATKDAAGAAKDAAGAVKDAAKPAGGK